MKNKKWIKVVAISTVVFTVFSSCKKEPEPTPLEPYSFQPSYLNESFMVETATIVSRTMADGSTADCYKVVFQSNPIADGPYCPARGAGKGHFKGFECLYSYLRSWGDYLCECSEKA